MAEALPPAEPAASLETIELEHVPATHSVNVAVFMDVENAEFLQQQLLGRNTEYEYAFIDATSVISRLQVLSAVYKAITTQLGGSMKTPNIHSEIVCSLSPNNNISEAYRRYGIAPASKHLIVVKVLISSSSSSPPRTAQDVERHLLDNVRGQICPFTDETLSGFTDWAKVRKYYKLNGIGWLDSIKDEGLRHKETEMLVLGSMALRGL
ncbi:CGI-121-domain-containing protein [Biscogniauxia marginata]|nr:CGI-121-domain-containing protein [Biscogniauxia marginata]